MRVRRANPRIGRPASGRNPGGGSLVFRAGGRPGFAIFGNGASPIQTEPQPAPRPLPAPAPTSTPGTALVRELALPLATLLDRLRKRAARVERARQVLFGLTAAVLLLLVATALTALQAQWARPAGFVAAGVALLVGFVFALVLGHRTLADEVQAARALGRASPQDASDFVSAVELSRALSFDSAQDERGKAARDERGKAARDERGLVAPISAAFVRAHVARMGVVAAAVDHRPALSARPVRAAALGLAAALLLHGLFWLFGGERVRDAYRYLAFRPQAKAATLFATEPIAGDISLTYRYPAHMHRPDKTIAETGGDIRAPKGTLVTVKAVADRDVARAFAMLGATAVPLTVSGRALSGTFLVQGPGEWRFRYATPTGKTVAEGPARPIAIEPDEPPEVRITQPKAKLVIEGKETITVGYAASDDYGLTKLELVYSLGRGTPEVHKRIASFVGMSRFQRGAVDWDLSALNLKPGDRVIYRIEATDNDDVSGPKVGVSASHELKVFSQVEHDQEVLQKAEEQWKKLLSGLADRLDEPPPGASGENVSSAWATATGATDGRMQDVSTGMLVLAQELLKDKRAPKEIGRALEHVGRRLRVVVEHTTAMRQVLVRRRGANLARTFAVVLGREVAEEENDVLYLEDLIDRRKLLDLAQLAKQLEEGRAELARLIERYEKAPSDAVRNEILGEIARLKERLAAIFQQMRKLQRGIQDQHLNLEALRQMSAGHDLMDELDEIQQELAQGKTKKALSDLEKMQKDLAQMQKQLEGAAGEQSARNQRIGLELQKLASNLLDVERDERRLKEKTRAMRAREEQAAQKEVQKLGQQFIQKQEQRLARAQAQLKSVQGGTVQQLQLATDLRYAEQRLEEAKQALDAHDFEGALDSAQQALSKEEAIEDELDSERNIPPQFRYLPDDQELVADSNHAKGAHQPTQNVVRDLKKLLDQARQPPTAAERQKMSQLAKEQGAVQKRTQDLQQQMEAIGREVPIFGPQQGQMLRQAAQRMQAAKGQLGQANPRGASGREQQALDQLHSFEQAMRSQKGGSGSGGIPMPFGSEGGGGSSGGTDGSGAGEQEKVEIPGADQSKAPAEFREELLKAMRDRTPGPYKQRVRQYYEELVK